MLRFLISTSLRLLIICAGIGLLICKQWGWPEYASPELYLIYDEVTNSGAPFFLINTDGNSQEEKLSWKNETLNTLRCSPDGRTLAFLTDKGELYLITETQALTHLSNIFVNAQDIASVANDGTVAFYAQDSVFFPPQISSSGILLSPQNSDAVKVISRDGRLLADLPSVTLPSWLASEQIFISESLLFDPVPVNPVGYSLLMDISTHQTAKMPSVDGVISPDGKMRAFVPGSGPHFEIFTADVFSDNDLRQLTHDSASPPDPLCFLTFRPQMLIAGS